MLSDFERTGKLQRKISIYYRNAGGFVYACSTKWWRTQRDAVAHWCEIHNVSRKDSRGRLAVIARFE